MRFDKTIVLVGALLASGLLHAHELELLPAVRAQLDVGMAGVFGDEAPQPYGAYDVRESGFFFQRLELGLDGLYGKHFRLVGDAALRLEGFDLDEAYAQVENLPLGMTVRAGLLRSEVGFENALPTHARVFTQQPLTLGRIFGPLGAQRLGTDFGIDIPVPWRLRAIVGMSAASGTGQRSFYGDAYPEISGLLDFVYELGLENVWTPGDALRIDLELWGTLGPNDTGRTNATNLWTVAWALHWREWTDHVGLGVATEFTLRRRQVIAGVDTDTSGYVLAQLTLSRAFGVATRYDMTQGTASDDLDSADSDLRHRVALQVEWRLAPWARLRVAGFADMGGPYAQDGAFGALMHLQVGYSEEAVVHARPALRPSTDSEVSDPDISDPDGATPADQEGK